MTQSEASYEKLARAVLKQYEIEIDERALPAIVETELLLQVPVLARAVLEQKETLERHDDTIKHLVGRSEWLEGEVTDLEEEIERLQSELRIEKASQATRGNN